jgi:hypothetical protein
MEVTAVSKTTRGGEDQAGCCEEAEIMGIETTVTIVKAEIICLFH